jgi:hypothetical protein
MANKPADCGSCGGDGDCVKCMGYGWKSNPDVECHRCGGDGVCVGCKGTGWSGAYEEDENSDDED